MQFITFLKNIIYYSTKFSFLAAIFITIFFIYKGNHFRWLGYESIPKPTLDEYDYAWLGQSIKESGLPTAWTTYDYLYKNPKLNSLGGSLEGFRIKLEDQEISTSKFIEIGKPIYAIKQLDWGDGIRHLFFVTPYFEHSPVGGLIFSSLIPSNVKDHSEVKPEDFRKPALRIAILNSFLIFILIYLISKKYWKAVLSVIIYSTVPTYLLATRTAFLENAATPFILMHLILLVLILNRGNIVTSRANYFLAFFSGVVGGLAVLTKEPSVGFLVGSVICLLIQKIPKKIIFVFISGTVIPLFIFVFWGLLINYEVFIEIFFANINRHYFGSLKLISMLSALRFTDFPIDGWWTWGFVSLIIVGINFNKKYLPLLIPFLGHFLLIILLSSLNYPWYYVSMIPFLACFSALALWQIFKNPNYLNTLVFFLIPLSSSFYWGYTVFRSNDIFPYRILFVIFFFFVFLRIKYGNYKYVRLIWAIFFVILVYQISKWNFQSMSFIIAHWGKLPVTSLPNF